MKYPIGRESLAKFCRVRVNVSDKVVREYRKRLQQTMTKSSSAVDIGVKKCENDINLINSNGLIPMVIIERPNDAGNLSTHI